MTSSRQLAAIMFTDIVGYTALMGKDSQKALELVHISKEIQKPLVEKHGGQWLKEMGDGALAKFGTALDAVNCAIDIQKAAYEELHGKLRIGVHSGDITIENEDIYGDGVNVASRLESIADPGGIYISDAIEKAIRGQSNIQAKFLGEIKLKNVGYEVRTYAIQGVGLPVPVIKEEQEITGHFIAELQRRGVFRAIIAYLVVAVFLIVLSREAGNWVTLPEIFTLLVIILLTVGFPIAIFLAWNYERSPKGFIRTTTKSSWQNPFSVTQRKPFTGSVVLIGLALASLVMFLIPRSSATREAASPATDAILIPAEKSIAVLPFKNLSDETGNQYFADGVQEAVLNHLSKIGALKVISRTSVEQYRETTKPMGQIGQELQVGYVLEGSAQKYGDQVRITVQLIGANQDDHLWAENYDRELTDIFNTISEIAEQIASELEATLNPKEAELIHKTPTSNLEAYDYYLRAKDYQHRYSGNLIDQDYESAMQLYRQCLDIDPELAMAYIGLGELYYSRNSFTQYFYEQPLDSVLMLSNKALDIDPNLADAYVLRGRYYYFLEGFKQRAKDDLQKALELDPNNPAYTLLGSWNTGARNYPEALRNFKTAQNLVRGRDRIDLNQQLVWFYNSIGDYDLAIKTVNDIIRLEPDNIRAWAALAHNNRCLGDWKKNLEIAEKIISLDRSGAYAANVGLIYMLNKNYAEAEKFFTQYYSLEGNKMSLIYYDDLHMYAFTLIKNGKLDEAEKRMDQAEDYFLAIVASKRPRAKDIGYELAKLYALQNKKADALKWLRHYEQTGFEVGLHDFAYYDPPFESLWGDPEFEAILERASERVARERKNIERLQREGYFDL